MESTYKPGSTEQAFPVPYQQDAIGRTIFHGDTGISKRMHIAIEAMKVRGVIGFNNVDTLVEQSFELADKMIAYESKTTVQQVTRLTDTN